MRRALFILLATALLPFGMAQAQGVPDYHDSINAFFTKIKEGKSPESAVDALMSSNPQVSLKMDQKLLTQSGVTEIMGKCGNFIEFNSVVDKLITPRFAYVYGIAIFKKQPVRFEFMFFKNDEGWVFFNVDFGYANAKEMRRLGSGFYDGEAKSVPK